MASPAYDAKYRKHDDAPGRVIPCSLLSPDPFAAALGAQACSGTVTVGVGLAVQGEGRARRGLQAPAARAASARRGTA